MKLPEKWQKVVEQNSEYIVQSVLGENEKKKKKKERERETFPGGPVVETPGFQCRSVGFNPWSGN